jgi:hypothetical protein
MFRIVHQGRIHVLFFECPDENSFDGTDQEVRKEPKKERTDHLQEKRDEVLLEQDFDLHQIRNGRAHSSPSNVFCTGPESQMFSNEESREGVNRTERTPPWQWTMVLCSSPTLSKPRSRALTIAVAIAPVPQESVSSSTPRS